MSSDSIDETRRKAFESAWLEGRPQPIERFLPPEDDGRHLATLEELVHIELEFTWKSWRAAPHDAPTVSPDHAPTQTSISPPRVESYLKRFPRLNQPEIVLRLLEQEHLARANWGDRPSMEEYRRRFPDIIPADWQPTMVASGEDEFQTIRAGAVIEPDVPDLPRPFGNYELLDVIGRGGMGIVYRARQVAADRTVALKVVRRDYLESVAQDTKASALERFHQEVQATARLEHKSIVSVYEVGDVDGEPFFSMQFIEGQSLAEILRDGPIPNREAAQYMVDVARAVAEAHRQDILHRDIKPQNILIDRAADRALVADFGLAKVLSSNEELTQSGDIMGSPPYMSPEQARDSSKVTTQSDIYAIGATVYHVLTGRPPFQAATALQTMILVTDQEPVPPRQLNPAIDRDLETICLKCLEKEPGRRYDSATALVEEFRRYLDGKPIVARPVGTIGRTVRWCRRNPVTATLIASTVAFLILALVATAVGYIRTTAALRVAEARFQHARHTVDNFCTNVSENILLNQPNMQPLRRELLEQALQYYHEFLDERGEDPTIQDELAKTYFRIGQISEMIDAPDDAFEAYRQALAMQEELVAARPKDPEVLDALGDTYTRYGGVLLRQERWKDAEEAYEKASEIRKRLVTVSLQHTEYERKLANTDMNKGVLAKQQGDVVLAEKRFMKAQTLRKQILARDPNATKVRRDLAMGLFNLASLHQSSKLRNLVAAQKELKEAAKLFEEVLAEDPADLMNQYHLVLCQRVLGDVESVTGDRSAENTYRNALTRLERLVRQNPTVLAYRAEMARAYMNVGLLYNEEGKQAEAIAALLRASELLEQVDIQCPDTPDYERNLAVTLYAVAELEISLSKDVAAKEHYERAKVQFEELLMKFPDDDVLKQNLEEIDGELMKIEERLKSDEASQL